MYMSTEKYNGSNCDRKSQFSGILTEPLNPHVLKLLPFNPSATFQLSMSTLTLAQLVCFNEDQITLST